MENNLMWLWWGFTVAICAWKIIEGLVRPRKMLEWPFLACAMWAYFYGYMAYFAKIHLSQYLSNGSSNLGQFIPLMCLVGILIGWRLGIQVKHLPPSQNRTYPYFWIWLTGIFFLLVGVVGGISVFRQVQNGTIDYKDSSAYWYLLFYVGYPGLAMSLWALFRMPPLTRAILGIITLLALIAFMFPHVFSARRGPLFSGVMVLLIVPPFATRRPPNPIIFCGALLAACLVMLLFMQARQVIYNGGSWSEAFQILDVNEAVAEKVDAAEDNEYINNCDMIATLYHNGKYQYGTGHMGLFLHWIPRTIWKNKPELGAGYYTSLELYDDVEAATGVQLAGSGASSGGVAESFVQYGFLCPVFWLGLSWVLAKVFVRATLGNSPRWIFCYVGFICASHWLVSQGFDAAFVPLCFFQAVPFVCFLIFGGRGPEKGQPYRRSRRHGLKEITQSAS